MSGKDDFRQSAGEYAKGCQKVNWNTVLLRPVTSPSLKATDHALNRAKGSRATGSTVVVRNEQGSVIWGPQEVSADFAAWELRSAFSKAGLFSDCQYNLMLCGHIAASSDIVVGEVTALIVGDSVEATSFSIGTAIPTSMHSRLAFHGSIELCPWNEELRLLDCYSHWEDCSDDSISQRLRPWRSWQARRSELCDMIVKFFPVINDPRNQKQKDVLFEVMRSGSGCVPIALGEGSCSDSSGGSIHRRPTRRFEVLIDGRRLTLETTINLAKIDSTFRNKGFAFA